MSKQKTILVTGGAGFIASHLIEELIKNNNNKVISLDNYFSGTEDNHIEGAEYIKGHTKDIFKLIKIKPDIIYHLGEYSRVAKSLEEPELVWDLNMEGTFRVLEFWKKHKCKLIYAGSSTKAVGAREDGVMGRDLSPYTWAKAVNTELVVNFGRWYNLDYAITYFYNVYGERERSIEEYGTVIETFKQKYLKGEELEVRSPGTQERSFTGVKDTVRGIILVGEKGQGDGYGISADKSYSLLEVARMFGGKIKMLPPTKSTRSHSVINTKKIKALGWKQEEKLKDYIKKIVN